MPAQFGDTDFGETATKKAKNSKIALTIFIHAPLNIYIYTVKHVVIPPNRQTTIQSINETSFMALWLHV